VPQVAEVPIGPTPPHETIALAKVAEPVAAPAEVPSFVPPPPAIAVDGVPPDLQVAAAPPAPPEPAPAFALPTGPELPVTPPPDLTVAAIDPVAPAPEPPPAAPVLAPTIDAVEIEGDGSFIAGNGPAGANMRLYVDGLPVGVSPVEGGRWLVEGTDLLTEQRQTLKVEALDPLTGKLLGDATVTFERPAAPVAEEPAEPETPPAADPITLPAEPAEQLEVKPPPADAAKPVTTGPPPAIPPIAPVAPSGESPSVTILKPAGEPAVTTLPTGKPSDDAVVTLGAAPRSPAVIAEFTLPTPKAAPSVTVLRAVPIGDPGAGRFVSGKAIIRRGDTLWDIAHRYYGRGVHYRTIVRANRDLIARPGKIYPGQVFDLPLVYDD
jgi:nucleoid-associated protein YgaU